MQDLEMSEIHLKAKKQRITGNSYDQNKLTNHKYTKERTKKSISPLKINNSKEDTLVK